VLNLTADTLFVSIADQKVSGLPNGVFISLPGDAGFDIFQLESGMLGYGDGANLHFEESGLMITLSGAHVFQARKSIDVPLLPENERSKRFVHMRDIAGRIAPQVGAGVLWSLVDDLLKRRLADIPTPTPWLHSTQEGLICLMSGLRSADEEVIMQGVLKLIGLGVGLTPSGDDLLTGCVGALALWGEVNPTEAWITPLLHSILVTAEGKTNRIALNYLHQAARCEISDELSDFISCLLTDSHTDPQHAVEGLFSYGASSGSELGLGAFLCLTAVANQRMGV
jgi:hypothetical protein